MQYHRLAQQRRWRSGDGGSYLLLPLRSGACAFNDLYWREGTRTEQFWTRKEGGASVIYKDVYA